MPVRDDGERRRGGRFRRAAGIREGDPVEANDLVACLPAREVRHRRLGPGRREPVLDETVAEEDDAVCEGERQLGALLGNHDRAPLRARVVEEGLRGVTVELRRRLVEQQQLGLESEHRR